MSTTQEQVSTPVDGRLIAARIDLVDESPFQERKVDPATLDGLMLDIEENGLLSPVVVREQGERLELVFGHRRLAASKRLGATTIEAIVREYSDDEARAAVTSENLHRENPNALEEGTAFARWLEDGMSRAQVARKFSVSERYVGERLMLCYLIPKARAAFTQGNLLPSHALEIAKLHDSLQERALAITLKPETWMNKEPSPSGAEIIEFKALISFITQHLTLKLENAPFPLDAEISPRACEGCPFRSDSDALFAVEGEEPRCMKPLCYQSKTDIYLQQLLENLPETVNGYPVVLITSEPESTAEGILTSSEWRYVYGSLDDVTHAGLMTDGVNRGKVFNIALKSADTSVRDAERSERSAQSAAAVAAARLEEEKERKKDQKERPFLIRSLYEQVMGGAAPAIDPDLWKQACQDFIAEMQQQTVVMFCKAIGVDPERIEGKAPYPSRYVETLQETIEGFSEETCQRLLPVLCAAVRIDARTHTTQKRIEDYRVINRIAELMGIDPAVARSVAHEPKTRQKKAGNTVPPTSLAAPESEAPEKEASPAASPKKRGKKKS